MLSAFLVFAAIAICAMFILILFNTNNKSTKFMDNLLSIFIDYSSWILSTISIILYILMKNDVFIAALLLVPYIFLMTITFLDQSFEINNESYQTLIIIIGILCSSIFTAFPYFHVKLIISLLFLAVAIKDILTGTKEYITQNKLRKFIKIAFYPFPILIFLILTLMF